VSLGCADIACKDLETLPFTEILPALDSKRKEEGGRFPSSKRLNPPSECHIRDEQRPSPLRPSHTRATQIQLDKMLAIDA